MKVISIVGARPQFVKAFPVSNALRTTHEEVLVHTGQHYDEELSDVFFDELPIPEPDVNLGVGSGTHAFQTAEMMLGIESVLEDIDGDAIVVYGDTNSTLAGALVGAKREEIVAHVEAGLRSRNRAMPEEINRIVVDHCADLLLTPSERATANLRAEQVWGTIRQTGDVMFDSLLEVREQALDQSSVLQRLDYGEKEYILATVHREANTDDPIRLRNIIAGLAAASLPVVLPAHPRTVKALHRHGLYEMASESVTLIDPVGYVDFVRLVDGAASVGTDSGGVQKEAFYLGVPCVTLREETEWPETVAAGGNVVVGADEVAIRDALDTHESAGEDSRPYGDGNAAIAVVDALEEAFASQSRE